MLAFLLGAVALQFPAHAGTAPARIAPVAPLDEPLGITLGVNYDSRLIYHGIDFGEHFASGDFVVDVPMNDSLQACLEASYGNVFDAAAIGGDYQRMLLGAGVTTYFGAAELGFLYRWTHHDGVPDSFAEDGHEGGFTLASSIGPLNIGAGGYRDFGDGGWYFEAAVNSEIKVNAKWNVVPGVAVGYGIDYAAGRTALNAVLGDGIFAVTPSLALPIKINDNTTVTPYISGRIAIDALDAAGATDCLYGGVSITVSF